jgi:hypothetical protein
LFNENSHSRVDQQAFNQKDHTPKAAAVSTLEAVPIGPKGFNSGYWELVFF